MTNLILLSSIVSVLIISCDSTSRRNDNSVVDSGTVKNTASTAKTENEFEKIQFDCDTVYKNKGYKIEIATFDTTIWDYDTIPNSIFVLHQELKGRHSVLFTDSIHTMFKAVWFEDFNGDNVKDILIQNISDVRSNPTYYLYLVDTAHDKLSKIKGFEEIKNPNYVSKYNLIDNYVLSGRNWTGFYKIQGDTIVDLDIQIEDDLADTSVYEKKYKKAIKKILGMNKNNR